MLRMRFLALALSFVSSIACSTAHADRVGPQRIAIRAPRTALALAPERVRAPFDVTLISEDGSPMATFARNGRYYVLGDAGARYVIKVANPTPNRVEAVVTVDGLDVIDGTAGDLRKRGYIVPPYGELRIEGFRTSASDVATFRFSAVGESYAGKQGKARNVGVIAVALFEEQAAPEIIEEQPIATGDDLRPRRYDDSKDDRDSAPRTRLPARRPPVGEVGAAGPAGQDKRGAPADERVAAKPAEIDGRARSMPAPDLAPSGGCCDPQPAPPRNERLGLGTEFGEQRYSAASYTRFVRGAGKPIAIAELRYNDRSGLVALGIPLSPEPDENELMMRETADPFPGDRFAQPPTR